MISGEIESSFLKKWPHLHSDTFQKNEFWGGYEYWSQDHGISKDLCIGVSPGTDSLKLFVIFYISV